MTRDILCKMAFAVARRATIVPIARQRPQLLTTKSIKLLFRFGDHGQSVDLMHWAVRCRTDEVRSILEEYEDSIPAAVCAFRRYLASQLGGSRVSSARLLCRLLKFRPDVILKAIAQVFIHAYTKKVSKYAKKVSPRKVFSVLCPSVRLST